MYDKRPGGMDTNPENIFGYSIFGFFVLSVLVFLYIAWRFFHHSGDRIKRGEQVMVWASLVGVVLVLVYALFAFVFKIII
ncbi:MAG: hypothetical protein OEW11_01660 [Nitrospirota bacterium]|nr:hypothetical protein [Nitrospirota bacterium]